MDTDQKDAITFIIPGQLVDSAHTRGGDGVGRVVTGATLGWPGTLKAAVQVGHRRAAGGAQRVQAVQGEDVVVLHLANGPVLVLHPLTARDLMMAQTDAVRRSAGVGRNKGQEAAPDVVEVPAQLRWSGLEDGVPSMRGASRGFLGDVLLSLVEVVTGPILEKAKDVTADLLVQRLDAQVVEGVYGLHPERFSRLKGQSPATNVGASEGGPTLVFVHGTFSDTFSSFGKLWEQHPRLVHALFSHYAGSVYALDHATLGRSPIDNAWSLASTLTPGTRLHLVTHSRGGLVAEVLARAAALEGLDEAAEQLFRVDKLPATFLKGLDAAGREAADQALNAQKQTLLQLIRHLRENRIVVERIVRVACPARGTLLASGRFDAYLSVFRWVLERSQVPVLPELLEFIGGVAQRRQDPSRIPGVAAMVPDSPLVQWLHAAQQPVSGQLRVVAGDLEGDSIGSWLKTLVTDAFYWTDNDLVVQTSSMYGGTPRETTATFLLDQGGQVTHFGYFAHEHTAQAVVDALTQNEPAGWQTIGPLSYAGESSSGLRAARRGPDDGRPVSEKPAVFVLPGILGSHIRVDDKRIWLGWRLIAGLDRLVYRDPESRRIEPDGAVGVTYDELLDFLAQTHEVVEFSFDWRKPIEQEARRLGKAVEEKLGAREMSGEPVRIVAHSMGGLVARAMQLECPATWDRMMARPGARLLMLGTPNGGSWAPMQVLSGDDTFGNTLVAFGAPLKDHEARSMMAQFPGFIQLQAALTNDSLGLHQITTWQKLAGDDLARVREHNWWHRDERQLAPYAWGVPTQTVLDAAVTLRRRLDEQREGALAACRDKVVLVVGRAKFTPDGYELGQEGLVYLNAPDAGDGRVTLANAMLPGVRTWRLDSEHGKLPDQKAAFPAFLELLTDGTTMRLPVQADPAAVRGAAGLASPLSHVRSRPARERRAPRPPRNPETMDWLAQDAQLMHAWERPAVGGPLRIVVQNGDLKFIRQPLMLGHYASSELTGTEWVVDQLIGGTMRESIGLGQYPDEPGTHQLFANSGINRDNPLQLPRPECVLVVGLGAEGKLKPKMLAQTVKLGVLALAQRLVEQRSTSPRFEVAATLLGSGGTGVSAGQAAQAIAEGVHEADSALWQLNERLRERPDRQWPRVGELRLVELYADRAGEAWRALLVQAEAAPGHFQLAEAVVAGPGALRRPLDGGYRGSNYDYIRAVTTRGDPDDTVIEYTVDTKRARSETHAQSTQALLVRELVARSSNDLDSDARIGITLFRLLVPLELEPFFGGTTELLLELDRGTAGIPWELLDAAPAAQAGGDGRPWAIRTKLVRKLRLGDFRQRVVDAGAEAQVLVIGEPDCDRKRYPRLSGARREARAVADLLSTEQALTSRGVQSLISPDEDSATGPAAQEVLKAMMARDWRVVHIAGHGEPQEKLGPEPKRTCDPPQKDGNPRGVVLSNEIFLGPREIRSMRVVPELVFLNCCHLAARNVGQLLAAEGHLAYDRSRFASGVAEELMKIGVRCVVAAGWAVDDEAAQAFAIAFYSALLRGARFIDAVGEARTAAWSLGGNTWAAYQCYGDPEWVLRREAGDAQRPVRPLGDEFRSVNAPRALTLALETLAVGSRFQGRPREVQQSKIRHLESRFQARWGNVGEVAEAFAVAWDAAGDRAAAIAWYERAVAANDGTASLKATEQLGNLSVRQAWQRVENASRRLHALQAELTGADERTRERRAGETEEAQQQLNVAIDQSRQAIQSALAQLEQLANMQPTVERLSLCGSAYKRLAMIEREAADDAQGKLALEEMLAACTKAEALAKATNASNFYYPALNRMAAAIAQGGDDPRQATLDPQSVALATQQLLSINRDDPDFWSVVGLNELRLYETLAQGELRGSLGLLIGAYTDLYTRMPGAQDWSSVIDQLRFVLHGVLRGGDDEERRAAQDLMDSVRSLVESPSRARRSMER